MVRGPRAYLRSVFLVVGVVVAAAGQMHGAEDAIQPGDKVKVVNGPAPIKVGKKTLATVETGTELKALKIQGDWVKVTIQREDTKLVGWIHSKKHLERVAGVAAQAAPKSRKPEAAPDGGPGGEERKPPPVLEERKAKGKARLHCAFVDAMSGEPVPGVALRVLGEPEIRCFQVKDLVALSDKVRIFGKDPVVLTNAGGVASLVPPMDLDMFLALASFGVGQMPRGYVVAHKVNAEAIGRRAEVSYMVIDAARTWGQRSELHAAYLPVVALVPQPKGQVTTRSIPSLNALDVRVSPRVVRIGAAVDIRVEWRYVRMPVMKSAVVANGKALSLVEPAHGSGRVRELWSAQKAFVARPDDGTGKRHVKIEAYLDAPYKKFPAATTRAPFYVAGSDAEEKAYKRLADAHELDAKRRDEAVATCRQLTDQFPKMQAAWAELGRRLAQAGSWQEVMDMWSKAPPEARKVYEVARAHALALENLGHKDKRVASLVSLIRSEGIPALARRISFLALMEEKEYNAATQVIEDAKQDLPRRTYVAAKRALSWMAGDRKSDDTERVWIADALLGYGNPKAALAVLANVDVQSVKSHGMGKFYTCLAEAKFADGDTKGAEDALASAANALSNGKRQAESWRKNPRRLRLLGKIAEQKGDTSTALECYAGLLAMRDSDVEAFSRALIAWTEKNAGSEPMVWTCSAFSLLIAHRFEEAVEVARKAVAVTPTSPAAQLALGLALEMTCKFDEAAEALRRAVELAPRDAYLKFEYENALALALKRGLDKQAAK